MKSHTISFQPADPESQPSFGSDEPFALMVLGDSMSPEFIEGDIVVVEPGGMAASGAFVIARIEQDWVLRRLDRCGDRWALAPENSRYKQVEILSLQDVKGVVIQRTHPLRRERRKRYVE